MPVDELGVGITDTVVAELVECEPVAAACDPALPAAPEATPTAQSLDAMIEQTGAGPPPKG